MDLTQRGMIAQMARRPPSPRSRRTTRASEGGREDSAPPSPVEVDAQLAALQSQFDLLKAQVRQAQQLASLGTAAATIAHEVNNLLTPIQAYCQAALDADDPGLSKRALEVTLKHVRMLVAMSERVLEMGAASCVKPQRAGVRKIVEDAQASLCRDLVKDGIQFLNQVDESVVVWVDALQLQQVLFNLMLNAREVMAPSHQGCLSVSAKPTGQRVIIEVHNSGEAIPPEFLPFVFELLETSKRPNPESRQRCSGLGLALCRDLIEENNGKITVKSSAENGTTFSLDLPAPGQEN